MNTQDQVSSQYSSRFAKLDYKQTPSRMPGAVEDKSRQFYYLMGMFSLCYFSWVAVHAQREFWALSKKTIQEEAPSLKTYYFGAIDTSLFLTYATAQFATGVIGDSLDRRKVLSASYVIQSCLFGVLGLAGMRCYFDHGHGMAASPLDSARTFQGMLWYFVAIFAAIGLI